MVQVILTCFAGRRRNLECLLAYTDILYERGNLHEVHLWNFTRKTEDEEWLREQFYRKACLWCSPSEHRSYVKLHEVSNKKIWREYYDYYTPSRFPDHVIMKVDDDVVYIDVDEFPGFVDRRVKNTEDILVFPSIINNGNCAHYQQQADLVPTSIAEFPLMQGPGGILWDSGRMCQELHEFFLGDVEGFLRKSKAVEISSHKIPIGYRTSINFFAILSKDLGIFQSIGNDDEHELTVRYPNSLSPQRTHSIDMRMVVVHLAFFRQRDTGLDEDAMLRKYSGLAKLEPERVMMPFIQSIPDIGKTPLKHIFETLGYKHKPATLWLEFGAYSGKTINYISQYTKDKVYAFDSFEGLPETWRRGYPKGTFDMKGRLPAVKDNVVLVKGWFKDTLPIFLPALRQKVTFVHMDCDLYSSSKLVLDEIFPYLDEECIIVFDELVNYPGYENGELRALKEFVDSRAVELTWIGMDGPINSNFTGHQSVALRIKLLETGTQ